MRRTHPLSLVVAAVLGAGAGYLLDQLLTAGGRATFTPMVSLPVMLVVLGAVVVALAVPIRRATHGSSGHPVNPFRAVRIAMLAKASSLVGAVFGGLGIGLVLFLTSRPASPSLGSMGAQIATIVCGAALVAAALIAEHLCTIRKDDDDEHPGDGPGADDGPHLAGGSHPAH